MASPFPGMNPYLEDPEIGRGVHHWLITAAGEQLQHQLNARGYDVDVESRIWFERPGRLAYPDIAVLRGAQPGDSSPSLPGGTLVADEPVRLQVVANEIREDYLQNHEIETRQLVTGIEFVSPTNKADRRGRRLYLAKRRRLCSAGVNVVEIDLLHGGKPLVRLPQAVLETIQPGGCVVNVIRAESPDCEFFPVDVRSRLPRVGIPLKPEEPDVVLDVQAAVAWVYNAGSYPLRIDFNLPTVPPLDEATENWANDLLVRAGLRPPATASGSTAQSRS